MVAVQLQGRIQSAAGSPIKEMRALEGIWPMGPVRIPLRQRGGFSTVRTESSYCQRRSHYRRRRLPNRRRRSATYESTRPESDAKYEREKLAIRWRALNSLMEKAGSCRGGRVDHFGRRIDGDRGRQLPPGHSRSDR